MADQNLDDAASTVCDAASFLDFLEALRADWERALIKEKQNPSTTYSAMYGWENTNIGSFLEAAIAGGKDTKIADGNAWTQAAKIILMGKNYE